MSSGIEKFDGDPKAGAVVSQKRDLALCSSCRNPALSFCAGCHNIQYCSKDCQKKDWKLHRSVCKPFANLEERPGPDYFRALFFPADEPAPRFVWIQDREYILNEEMEKLVGYAGMRFETTEFDHDYVLDRRVGHSIELIYNAYFRVDGSPVNQALQELKGIEFGSSWRGGFLARGYTTKGGNEEPDEFIDVDMDTKSLKPIVHFMNSRVWSQLAMDHVDRNLSQDQ